MLGRWISPDPYGQYHSSYLAMGNTPVNGVDPDGGFLFGLFGDKNKRRYKKTGQGSYGGRSSSRQKKGSSGSVGGLGEVTDNVVNVVGRHPLTGEAGIFEVSGAAVLAMYREARYAAEQLLDDPVAVANERDHSPADAMARSEYLEHLDFQQGISNMRQAKGELDALKGIQASLNSNKIALVDGGNPFGVSYGTTIPIQNSSSDNALLKRVIRKGMESSTFRSLLRKQGISYDNMFEKILIGDRTVTRPRSKTIGLKRSSNINSMVVGLTHELSNLDHTDTYNGLIEKVAKGDISPEQYADKVLEREAWGITYQIAVSSDLNIGYNAYRELYDKYSRNLISLHGIYRQVLHHISNAKSKDTGKNARQSYIKKAKTMRNTYLDIQRSQEIERKRAENDTVK